MISELYFILHILIGVKLQIRIKSHHVEVLKDIFKFVSFGSTKLAGFSLILISSP